MAAALGGEMGQLQAELQAELQRHQRRNLLETLRAECQEFEARVPRLTAERSLVYVMLFTIIAAYFMQACVTIVLLSRKGKPFKDLAKYAIAPLCGWAVILGVAFAVAKRFLIIGMDRQRYRDLFGLVCTVCGLTAMAMGMAVEPTQAYCTKDGKLVVASIDPQVILTYIYAICVYLPVAWDFWDRFVSHVVAIVAAGAP